MKKNALIVLLLIQAFVLHAQPLRIHLMGGFANYSGDLQPAKFTLKQAQGVMTVGATYNLTNKLAVRGEYSFAKIGADDKLSKRAEFIARNLNFKTIIQELSLLAEYDLFDTYQQAFTPYVFLGVGVFHASPYTFDSANTKIFLAGVGTEAQGVKPYEGRKVFNRTQINVPIGGGLKYAISNNVQVAAELGVRFYNSDYIDDVSRNYVPAGFLLQQRGPLAVALAFRGDELKSNPQAYPSAGTPRGTVKGNDYYYFGQLRISFRLNWFNRGIDRGGAGLKSLSCPAKL